MTWPAQWDAAVEFGILEEAFAPGGARAFDAIAAALARCADRLPAAIPAGLHPCYGDYSHQHFKQPESLALQARVLNAVAVVAGAVAFLVVWAALFLLQLRALDPRRRPTSRFPTPPDQAWTTSRFVSLAPANDAQSPTVASGDHGSHGRPRPAGPSARCADGSHSAALPWSRCLSNTSDWRFAHPQEMRQVDLREPVTQLIV